MQDMFNEKDKTKVKQCQDEVKALFDVPNLEAMKSTGQKCLKFGPQFFNYYMLTPYVSGMFRPRPHLHPVIIGARAYRHAHVSLRFECM